MVDDRIGLEQGLRQHDGFCGCFHGGGEIEERQSTDENAEDYF
jgi:hypothetical protein